MNILSGLVKMIHFCGLANVVDALIFEEPSLKLIEIITNIFRIWFIIKKFFDSNQPKKTVCINVIFAAKFSEH